MEEDEKVLLPRGSGKSTMIANSIKNEILADLLKQEWAAGNGQCRRCWGLSKGFYPQHDYEEIGHKEGCSSGMVIRLLGGVTYFKGELKTDKTDPIWIADRARWASLFKGMYDKDVKGEK